MKSCSLHTHESKLIFVKNIDNCMCMSVTFAWNGSNKVNSHDCNILYLILCLKLALQAFEKDDLIVLLDSALKLFS